jgi:hypothetical protein
MCLNVEDNRIVPGCRVLASSPSFKFINDKETPWRSSLVPATIVCRYGEKQIWHHNMFTNVYGETIGEPDIWLYPDMVKLIYDEEPTRIYSGRFTDSVVVMDNQESFKDYCLGI